MYRETKTEGEAVDVVVRAKPVDAIGQILLNAADLLEKHGWCQGRWESAGAMCARTAIAHASPDQITCYRAEERLELFLHCRPCVWNDEPGRTLKQVTTAMRSAAR